MAKPVSLRRKALAGIFASAMVVSVAACSTDPIVSNTNSTTSESPLAGTTDVGKDSADLFDASASHTISLNISQDDIDKILEAYKNDDEKTWVSADITIDGTEIKNVGVRLKGNSSLMWLSGNAPGGGQPPQGQANQDQAATDEASASDNNNAANPPQGMGNRSGSSIDASDPTTLPLLIKFDKYVDGQLYQGMSELSLRSGVPSLNEATALSALSMTDQATQRYSYVTYSVNGGSTLTRIVLETPDEYYAARLGDGILYKADASSSLTYQGDDEDTYTDQFKQQNGDDNEQPIIDFLKWLDSADDQEFEDNLDKYVDVESLAKYIATQNLLVNSDDMAGPGRNYYLWYDNSTKKLSVLAWDMDMSMQGNAELSPDSTASMGMGGGKPGQAPGAGAQGATDATAADQTDQATQDNQPTQTDQNGQQAAPGGMGGGMSSGADKLKERFLASSKFKAIYEQQYWELYDQLYGNGALAGVVDQLRTQVPATDSLSQDEINTDADTLASFIQQRTDYLASQRTASTSSAS